MRKFWVSLLFLVSFTFAYASDPDLVGQWKITQWLTGLAIGNLNQSDIDSMPGDTLIIGPHTISLKTSALEPEDRSCNIDNADRGWIQQNAYDYFVTNGGYRLDKAGIQSLGLQPPFWHLDAFCMEVFTRPDPNEIVLFFGSSFFEAIRQQGGS